MVKECIEIARELVDIEELSYYDGPLLVSAKNADTGTIYLIVWTDESENISQWHALQVTRELLDKVVSTDPLVAVPFIDAFKQASAIWVINCTDYYRWFLTKENKFLGVSVSFEEIPESCLPLGNVRLNCI